MYRSMTAALKTSGLFLLLFIALTSVASAIPIQLSNAPKDDLDLTVSAIASAKASIFLNIYELSSADISDALLKQIKSGIQVVILEEGAPVGGMSTASKGIEGQLVAAMNNFKTDHFFQMGGKTNVGKRRYTYDHAKYAVIDNQYVLIGSENYSPTGNPSPGTLGNRGWEVFISDTALAQDFKSVFTTDISTQFGDVKDLTSNAVSSLSSETLAVRNLPNRLSADQVTRITSPDSSEGGLVNLINSAQKSIDIEQMTFDSNWNKKSGASPLAAAILAAAKRNVIVRILLNDEHVFDHPGKPAAPHNTDTIALFANIPNVQAKVANLKAMGVDYIHNKGMLIDSDITLISSINWDQNSIEKNREAAVSIKSNSVNQYYQNLFNQDWQAGVALDEFADLTVPMKESVSSCPVALHADVNIQELAVSDSDDRDFLSLSDHKISADFQMDPKLAGCVLVQKDSERPTQERLTLEFRTRGNTMLFSLEGYTPQSKKLYSIRANFNSVNPQNKFSATLYDGSGPSREALGKSTVELK